MHTVKTIHQAEIEEKGSRFIAHLVPIHQFEETLAQLRQKHKKASHHVTAFRTINEYDQINEIGKDDGEPAGTSGMPVLKTLIGADLINVAMIVTRYFGGTKLGTGGLARAYSGASNAVIQKAELQPWKRLLKLELHVSFENSAKIETKILTNNVTVLDRVFETDGVRFQLEGTSDALLVFSEYQN